MVIRAELIGRDLIETKLDSSGAINRFKVVGCRALLDLVRELKSKNSDPFKWEIPTGRSHVEILMREFLLRLQNKWEFPYQDAEICHCRVVSTQRVDQAIIAGAHTTSAVSRATSASTSCGTCEPDVQQLINFRLGVS